MKALTQRIIGLAVLAAVAASGPLLSSPSPGRWTLLHPARVVSACVGDLNGDGKPELLAILDEADRPHGTEPKAISVYEDRLTREERDALEGSLPGPARSGRALYVFDASRPLGSEPFGLYLCLARFGMDGMAPNKVQLCNVTGGDYPELSVTMYKATTYHPVRTLRPFFFTFRNDVESFGRLEPLWMGSRLSRPFEDYLLRDLDGDGLDEIIALERLPDGGYIYSAYRWQSFGFAILAESDPIAKKPPGMDDVVYLAPDKLAVTKGDA